MSEIDNKVGDTEFNEKLLTRITNGWSRQAYVQGFDFKAFYLNRLLKSLI